MSPEFVDEMIDAVPESLRYLVDGMAYALISAMGPDKWERMEPREREAMRVNAAAILKGSHDFAVEGAWQKAVKASATSFTR